MKNKLFKMLLLSLSLILCFCLIFTSCDSSESDDDEEETEKTSNGGESTSTSGVGGTTDSSNQGGTTGSSDQGDTTDSSNQGGTTGSSDQGDTTGSSDQGDTTGSSDQGGTTGSSDQGGTTDSSNQGGTTDSSNQGGVDDKPCSHKEETVDGKAPTCTETGLTDGKKCSECGEILVEQEEIPANGHKEETVDGKAPTCTEAGLTDGKKCSECGEILVEQEEISEAGHTYERGDNLFDEEAGVTYIEAQCGVDGYFERVCKDCGYDEEPFTREMYKQLESVPNSQYDNDFYQNMGGLKHDFSEYVGEIPATCTETSYKVYKCSHCDEEESVMSGLPNGHSYFMGEQAKEDIHYVIATAPTCMTEGLKVFKCTACGEPSEDAAYTEVIPCLPHDTSNRDEAYLIMSVPANCTDAAYSIYRCCNGECDTIGTVYEGEALGHDWRKTGDPSCLTAGKTPYECGSCKEKILEQDEFSVPLDEIKHVLGEMVAEATCITNAVYVCGLCQEEYAPYEGDEVYDDGFAHGIHNLVYSETVEPTCYSEGYKIYACNADESCTVSGKNTDQNNLDEPLSQDVTPRLSHSFTVENGRTTVTNDGRLECANCALQYRDVYTEISVFTETLCQGCGMTPCSCEITFETTSYTVADAIQLLPGMQLDISTVEWSDGTVNPLALGGGVIAIVGYEGVNYSVSIYNGDGDQLCNFFESGEHMYIDLYKYEDVSKIVITASSYATVRLCALIG